jgi:hypothetical protein
MRPPTDPVTSSRRDAIPLAPRGIGKGKARHTLAHEHPISVSYGMLRVPFDSGAINGVAAPADIPGWPRFA